MKLDSRLEWAFKKILQRIETPKFYGSVTLIFQAGKLTCLKTEQTEKPEAEPDNQ